MIRFDRVRRGLRGVLVLAVTLGLSNVAGARSADEVVFAGYGGSLESLFWADMWNREIEAKR